MTKKQIFATIKEANEIVSKMNCLKTDSKEYKTLSDTLYWTLDIFTGCKNCNLHISKNGKYYVTFS